MEDAIGQKLEAAQADTGGSKQQYGKLGQGASGNLFKPAVGGAGRV